MGNYEYRVTILNENNMISGNLREVHESDRQADFNPLTVLGDLLDIVTYTGTSTNPQDNYYLNEDYRKHPFFLGREYQVNPLFQKPSCFKHFFVAVNELKEIVTSNSHFSMSAFEILKQFLSLKFTYKIEFREINPLYDLGYKENPINHKAVQEHQYIPLQYTYDYAMDMDAVLDNNSGTPHKFTYTCYAIEDIIFSVLHYLVLFKYKFRECEHCGNYFAVKEFKEKYCPRKSPYTYSPYKNTSTHKSPPKNPKDYNCRDAADLIKNRIRNKISRLCEDIDEKEGDSPQTYQNISNENILSKDYSSQAHRDFLDECKPYQDIIKKQASVNNLELFECFLAKKKEEIHANKKGPPTSR
jgi:hypothetical protein